jgi:hypothetical protein
MKSIRILFSIGVWLCLLQTASAQQTTIGVQSLNSRYYMLDYTLERYDGKVIHYEPDIIIGSVGLFFERSQEKHYWIVSFDYGGQKNEQNNWLTYKTFTDSSFFQQIGRGIRVGFEYGKVSTLRTNLRLKTGLFVLGIVPLKNESLSSIDRFEDGIQTATFEIKQKGGGAFQLAAGVRARLETTLGKRLDLGLATWYYMRIGFTPADITTVFNDYDSAGLLTNQRISIRKYSGGFFSMGNKLIPMIYLGYNLNRKP